MPSKNIGKKKNWKKSQLKKVQVVFPPLFSLVCWICTCFMVISKSNKNNWTKCMRYHDIYRIFMYLCQKHAFQFDECEMRTRITTLQRVQVHMTFTEHAYIFFIILLFNLWDCTIAPQVLVHLLAVGPKGFTFYLVHSHSHYLREHRNIWTPGIHLVFRKK